MTDSITSQIAGLQRMSVAQLRQKMEELTGQECRQTHRRWLIKRVAFLIQEKLLGGLAPETKERIDALRKELQGTDPSTWFNPPARNAQEARRRRHKHGRDPRLPQPGTILTRFHKGTEHQVEVLDKGFLFKDRQFGSLSAVAGEICGCNISGFAFFRLNGEGKIHE